MAAIEIRGLHKTYHLGFWKKRTKLALHPLDLKVEEGEIFGYLGPNGAGKTTTLRILMGIIFPSGGSATILGHDMQDPRVKAQLGFLPEQPYFYDYLSAPELLDYYGQLSGVLSRDRKKKVQAMLDRVGLKNVGRLQLRKFSKGMLQRVGIAQALLHDPKIVFLDEPMSGLDPIGRREVRDLIAGLREERKTVFFSTHILSDAEALCDRVAVLNEGQVRAVGTVDELTAGTGGKVELLFQGMAAAQGLKALGADCRVVGETVRAIVPDALLDQAIDAGRRAKAKLISVTPVRMTLEDYFMRQIGTPAAEVPQEVAR